MRRLVALFALLVMFVPLAACGGGSDGGSSSDEVSPGDVAMMYVDAFRGDSAALLDYNEQSQFDDSYFESLGAGSTQAWGVTFDAEQSARVAAAFKEALGAVEAEVVDEEIDGDTAVVTLSVAGIGFDAAMAEAAKTFQAPAGRDAEAYAALLVRALEASGPVADPTEVELSLTAKGDLWVPESSSATGLVRALVR